MRVEEVLTLLRRFFPNASVKRVMHKRVRGVRIISIEAATENYRIIVREVWGGGDLSRYGYQLLRDDNNILRCDNAPHHKHRGSRVEPLENPSLENFLKEAKHMVERGLQP